MSLIPPNRRPRTIRGIRDSINSGEILGRASSGQGPVEPITLPDLARGLTRTGIVGTGDGDVTVSGTPSVNDITQFASTDVIERSGLTSDGILIQQTVTTKLASGKQVTVTHGSTQTLLSYSGRGHVKSIWLSVTNSGDTASVPTSTIAITRDGEVSPSISLQAQDLFNSRGVVVGQFYQTGRLGVGLGAPAWIKIDIPFETSISVTFTNSSGSSSALVWWNIEYQDDDANLNRGTREHLHATKVSASVTAYSEETLIDVSGPAMLVGLTGQWRGGDGNYNYLEGKIQAYIDSEGTASYASSGTEDFFKMAGFARIAGPATQFCLDDFGTPFSDDNAMVGFYRWLHDCPIYGASHLKFTWTAGISSIATVTNPTGIDLVAWYYTTT